jgi:hypothetical protein
MNFKAFLGYAIHDIITNCPFNQENELINVAVMYSFRDNDLESPES